jgi:hypothetical protein
MQHSLLSWPQPMIGHVCVNIPGQEQRLEEQQASRPNGRAAPKLRQNVLAYERLNLK